MQDETWVKGMKELFASFPDRDHDEAVMTVRGEVYRRELGHLLDGTWLYAVRESIRKERWFPTVAVLLEYAEAAPSTAPALPPHRMTDEERAEAREQTRRGLEMVRAAVERITGEPAPEAVKSMPGSE